MQAALAAKSEEKKKAATSRPEAALAVEPMMEEMYVSTDMPYLLRRGIQRKLAVGASDDSWRNEAESTGHPAVHPGALSLVSRPPAGHIQRKCSGYSGSQKCPACRQREALNLQTKSSAARTQPLFLQRSCSCGGTCASCGGKKEEEKAGILQRHSAMGSAGQTQPLFLQRSCSCGGTCASCKGSLEERVQLLQRHTPNGAGGQVSSKIVPSDSPGHPLDDSTRTLMESRLGSDLSWVRVHTDSRAAESAKALQADAYATGADIYFGQGKYEPEFQHGKHLLAHELAHTQQQSRGATPIAASHTGGLTVGDAHDPLEDEAERVADAVVSGRHNAAPVLPDSGSTVRRFPTSLDELEDDLESAGQAVINTAEDAADEIAEDVGAAVDWAGERIDQAEQAVEGLASDALDWLESEAGEAAQALAHYLGVDISVTSAGLLIRVPRFCPLPAVTFNFKLPGIDKELMVPIFALPLGPVLLTGEVGLVGHIKPKAEIQIGPVCLNGVTILINPITGTYDISGSVSATAGLSLAAEIRGGLRGELGLEGVIPIGGVPVPIKIPLLGVEGGVAGLLRGMAGGTLTIGNSLSISGSTISMDAPRQLDLGLAADLFLGAYAQLDLLGENVCRIYWQPYEWHGDIAGSLQTSIGLSLTPGSTTAIVPRVTPPTFGRIPFNAIPLVLSRKGFSDDCPIKDRVCELLKTLHLLPSQNGSSWSWAGPYGPGPRLAGPLDVYQKNPGVPSGSECRGACGANCETCTPTSTYRYTDPATGDVWLYTNFQDCNSNGGCREHDAAFDWAADKHGETGRWAIIMPWHMAANIECTCNNLTGNCIAWIVGLPPYDSKIYFADTATLISHGGGKPPGALSGSCHADYPNAPDCLASYPDRDTVLNNWGSPRGISYFRDCVVAENHAPGTMTQCGGGPGNVWHCHAADMGTGQEVTVSIFECICCNDDDSSASQWNDPQIVITAGMSEELILELCERNLIPRVICIPIEEDMIARFGNRRRDINIDPDKDPKGHLRPDDAPIVQEFRQSYNWIDSWHIYIRANHPEWYPEFNAFFAGGFDVQRENWVNALKKATKHYKERFRNVTETDRSQIEGEYKTEVSKIKDDIDAHLRKVASWYKVKTGSPETIEEIIERVHTEGTELWRAAWRRAILQVNRVLARLWPPAKTAILVWVGVQRMRHPHVDLSGPVGELDYIGSLATGYKGPPKQLIRFNPDQFDVDANLVAPPLAKWALAVDPTVPKPRPDKGRIFGRTTGIEPLNRFSGDAHAELTARVHGYNSADPFDVAIASAELPEQERERVATERLYRLRDSLPAPRYQQLLDDLRSGGFLNSAGTAIRANLTEAEFDEVNTIMDRYGP